MGNRPEEILKEVAEVGYKYIEAADYRDGKFYGMTPDEFKSTLEELDLVPLSAHMGTVTLENTDQLITDVKAAGFKYFVIPVPPMGYFQYDRETRTPSMSDDLEGLTGILTTLGKKCKEAGLEMLYHNHNFEFEENKNGIIPIEYFLEQKKQSGMVYYIVEQDQTFDGMKPLEAIRISHDGLKKFGFR